MGETTTVKPLITRRLGGNSEAVPVEEAWDSICKVLRLARVLTSPGGEQYLNARLSMLCERLNDLEGLEFNYRRHPFGTCLPECFVELPKS